MKLIVACILTLALVQSQVVVSTAQAFQHTTALKWYLLNDYEKDVKPDGQVTVKYGVEVTDISLCAHKQVFLTGLNAN